MKFNTKCPECSEILREKQTICACGWSKKIERENSHIHQCCYQSQGRRCKLRGAISLSLRGNNFLCSAHFQSRNDEELSEAILEDIEKNYDLWIAPRKDWRDELLEKHLLKYKNRIQKDRNLKELVEEIRAKILLK